MVHRFIRLHDARLTESSDAFFIVAGLVLLWLNMRKWRRRKVRISFDQHHESRNDLRGFKRGCFSQLLNRF